MLTGADTNLALPFGVGQLLIGDIVLFDAFPRGIDDARAHGQTKPVVAGIAILAGNGLLQRDQIDRLCEPGLLGLRQPTRIDGEQQVGRAILPLSGETLV